MTYLKQKWPFALGFVVSVILLIVCIIFTDPDHENIANFVLISPVYLFFLLVFAVFMTLGTYVFKNIRRGILLAIFITAVLLLRYSGFDDLLYLGIVLLILILVEGFFLTNTKKAKQSAPDEI